MDSIILTGFKHGQCQGIVLSEEAAQRNLLDRVVQKATVCHLQAVRRGAHAVTVNFKCWPRERHSTLRFVQRIHQRGVFAGK